MSELESQQYDAILAQLADYVCHFNSYSDVALETAGYCLLDAMGCAMQALNEAEANVHLGPLVPGSTVPQGVQVPGTTFYLDPVKAAWDISSLIRWLDFNDTWLDLEWGHPSDNLGAILSTAAFRHAGGQPMNMLCVLHAMIQAYEIQGVLSMSASLNRLGLDHVGWVRLASVAVGMRLLGGTRASIMDALSHALADGFALRVYRHAGNTTQRKCWAAGDASARAVQLALMVLQGAPGLPSVFTRERWGVLDVIFRGQPWSLTQELGCYVMENILFKVAHPAEFHAQTAVECALQLHPLLVDRLDMVERVRIFTQKPAVDIIAKEGHLASRSDRDHCLQYMVAVSLVYGRLTVQDYADEVAHDPRVEALRATCEVIEKPAYTEAYYNREKRAIANAIEVTLHGGASLPMVESLYPLGHRRRREESLPLLIEKFRANTEARFSKQRVDELIAACLDRDTNARMSVPAFLDLWSH